MYWYFCYLTDTGWEFHVPLALTSGEKAQYLLDSGPIVPVPFSDLVAGEEIYQSLSKERRLFPWLFWKICYGL